MQSREEHFRSYVAGCGSWLPEKVVDNNYFAEYLDTSDEWIKSRTGIAQRHWVDEGVSASDASLPAAQQALERAGVSASEVDGIIVGTVTPDYVFPSTACMLQSKLGCPPGLAFDVNAVCSGFVYALANADALIRAGIAKNILVLGVDLYSRIIDKNDRRTCILFGDGAGAVLLRRLEDSSEDRGVVRSVLGADGSYTDILKTPLGTAAPATPESLKGGEHFLQMDGREVFKLAVRRLAEINQQAADAFGCGVEGVKYYVSHQANERILSSVAKHLGAAEAQLPMNVAMTGNTSAASIPILLAELAGAGKIERGDKIVLSAFGGGVTWGTNSIIW